MKTIRVVAAIIKAVNDKGEPIIFATQRGYGEFKDLLRNFLIGIKKASPKDHELYSEEILEREINEINGYSGPAEPYVEGDE